MDEWDSKAEALLPCPTYKDTIICHDPETGKTTHASNCQAWRRPIVAIELRKMGEEIERLREAMFHPYDDKAAYLRGLEECFEITDGHDRCIAIRIIQSKINEARGK